jgi:hypothetical protein
MDKNETNLMNEALDIMNMYDKKTVKEEKKEVKQEEKKEK